MTPLEEKIQAVLDDKEFSPSKLIAVIGAVIYQQMSTLAPLKSASLGSLNLTAQRLAEAKFWLDQAESTLDRELKEAQTPKLVGLDGRKIN